MRKTRVAHKAALRSPGRPPCRRTTSALWHPLYIDKTALQPSLQNINLIWKNYRKAGAKAAARRWPASHLDTHRARSYCPNRALPSILERPLVSVVFEGNSCVFGLQWGDEG